MPCERLCSLAPEPPRPEDGQCCSGANHRAAHRRADEAIFIYLVPGNTLKPMERQYVRLSAFATINTVKRLLAYMLQEGDITKYNSYDVRVLTHFPIANILPSFSYRYSAGTS